VGPEALPFEQSTQDPSVRVRRFGVSRTLSSLRALTLLCVLLPLLAYAAVGIYRYRQIRAETELRLDRSLRIADEHALKVLDTAQTMLARMQDALGGQDDAALRAREEQLHRQLRAMRGNKPQVQGLWVIGADGRPVIGDRYFPVPTGVDMSDREYFAHHRLHPAGIFVSGPLRGRVSTDRVINVSEGRFAPDGRFLGVVLISLLPAYFEQFHSTLVADEPGLAITMLRQDGVILSRWPVLPNAPASLSPGSPVMTHIRAGDTSGEVHGVSSVDNRQRLLMFRKVGDYPVFLGTGMEVAEIRNRWLEEMAWLAAFGLPPLLGLYLAARVALRRTRESLAAADRLNDETVARRQVEEALLQAQKLEALGRLTGGVAHDFNNALMVISNNLALIRIKHPDVAAPQVESIGRAVGSATKLTRQLLAFSRRQALVPEVIDLAERLPSMKDLLSPVLGGKVQLELQAEADTRPILVDSAEFELALINLAINARDAMPDGGRFTITARNATAAEVPPLLQGPLVLVEAADSGNGIPPDVIDKVFDPFFTTKPVGQGTGLGLSQVYGLCQRAGGAATIASKSGRGTIVRMFFPATRTGEKAVADAPPALQRNLGKRLLMVEDNDDVAAALQQVLEAMGCDVTRRDRAAAGLEWLQEQGRSGALPDLMLSDVVMPGEMDGLGLARAVRAQYPELRIVLMTGYAQQLDAISKAGFECCPSRVCRRCWPTHWRARPADRGSDAVAAPALSHRDGCSHFDFTAQRFEQVGQQRGEFAGEDRGIGVEAVVVLAALLHAVHHHVQQLQLAHLRALRQHEGDAVVPRHGELGRQLALGDVLRHFVDLEGMPRIAHRGFLVVRRLQLAIAIHGEADRRLARRQPVRHAGHRGFVGLHRPHSHGRP
jgi:signal transduction histidine kinase/CheY-like chemotaxis protein